MADAHLQMEPDGAGEKTTRYHRAFAAVVQEWWPRSAWIRFECMETKP